MNQIRNPVLGTSGVQRLIIHSSGTSRSSPPTGKGKIESTTFLVLEGP